MKSKEFNNKSLSLLLNKHCKLSFFSAQFAQGPSGLIFAIFDDNSLYYINQNNRKYRSSILKNIKSYVPEMAFPIHCDFKKNKQTSFPGFLGGGNCYSMIESEMEKYLDYSRKNQSVPAYKRFKEYLIKEYGLNIKDLFSLSMK